MKRIDCPNCRSRPRRHIAVGPFDFCNVACAVAYKYKLEGWIARQQHDLDALATALLANTLPSVPLGTSLKVPL